MSNQGFIAFCHPLWNSALTSFISNIDYWSYWKDLADTSLWKLLPVHVICWGCSAAWAWFQDIWLLPPAPALPRNQYFKCSMTSRFIRKGLARLPSIVWQTAEWYQSRWGCSWYWRKRRRGKKRMKNDEDRSGPGLQKSKGSEQPQCHFATVVKMYVCFSVWGQT